MSPESVPIGNGNGKNPGTQEGLPSGKGFALEVDTRGVKIRRRLEGWGLIPNSPRDLSRFTLSLAFSLVSDPTSHNNYIRQFMALNDFGINSNKFRGLTVTFLTNEDSIETGEQMGIRFNENELNSFRARTLTLSSEKIALQTLIALLPESSLLGALHGLSSNERVDKTYRFLNNWGFVGITGCSSKLREEIARRIESQPISQSAREELGELLSSVHGRSIEFHGDRGEIEGILSGMHRHDTHRHWGGDWIG